MSKVGLWLLLHQFSPDSKSLNTLLWASPVPTIFQIGRRV